MHTTFVHKSRLAVLIVTLMATRPVMATIVPFTEDFASGHSNWFTSSVTTPMTWNAAGGPDGGSYASAGFNFVTLAVDDNPVIMRGQDELGSSGGAFVGNWIIDGVTQFSAFVRHDAGMPLTFFTRFALPANFPGASAVNFIPVLSDDWTPITIGIQPDNPQFVTFEGQSFDFVFSNIGHVQLGVSVPSGLAGVDRTITFDLDKVSIVPEPATLVLVALGAGLLVQRRARRSGGP